MKQSNLQKRRIISWALVIVMMTVIFMFSAKTANDSEQMSMGVTRLVTKLMGITQAEAGTFGSSLYDMLSVIDHYVRKTAHFMEYALLAVLVFRALKIDVYQKIHLFLLPGSYALSMQQQMNFINILSREEAVRSGML